MQRGSAGRTRHAGAIGSWTHPDPRHLSHLRDKPHVEPFNDDARDELSPPFAVPAFATPLVDPDDDPRATSARILQCLVDASGTDASERVDGMLAQLTIVCVSRDGSRSPTRQAAHLPALLDQESAMVVQDDDARVPFRFTLRKSTVLCADAFSMAPANRPVTPTNLVDVGKTRELVDRMGSV